MSNDLWLNLPVRDVARSRAFLEAVGFPAVQRELGPDMAGVRVGAVPVMLVAEAKFSQFAGTSVADPSKGAEVMMSFGADSRAEVDAVCERVRRAGGQVFAGPAEHDGWMYGAGFVDLDGHRWNVLYMDPTRA